ncbi:hypothetical protein MSAN_02095000 [Mycena sanguinolenta]|uniref:Uncharacterized protein n=1 Tax=Mycena sanguinolenta TaxID=230812 RepID=A0A8H6XIK5_9AGAR|nr:hypothetical protein MSAN_02095000 [Mycena sanguinolenta]
MAQQPDPLPHPCTADFDEALQANSSSHALSILHNEVAHRAPGHVTPCHGDDPILYIAVAIPADRYKLRHRTACSPQGHYSLLVWCCHRAEDETCRPQSALACARPATPLRARRQNPLKHGAFELTA